MDMNRLYSNMDEPILHSSLELTTTKHLIHTFNPGTNESGAAVSKLFDGAIGLDSGGNNNVRVFTVGSIFFSVMFR